MDQSTIYIHVVGESSSGKTRLVHRYTKGSEEYNEYITGSSYECSKQVVIDSKPVNLEIYICNSYAIRDDLLLDSYPMRQIDGVLVVFDVTKDLPYSFIKDHLYRGQIMLLVGNKIDREGDREVTTEQGKEMAVAYGIDYMETSAADGTGVNEAFTKLAEKIYCQKFETSLDEPIKLHQPQTQQRHTCKI